MTHLSPLVAFRLLKQLGAVQVITCPLAIGGRTTKNEEEQNLHEKNSSYVPQEAGARQGRRGDSYVYKNNLRRCSNDDESRSDPFPGSQVATKSVRGAMAYEPVALARRPLAVHDKPERLRLFGGR